MREEKMVLQLAPLVQVRKENWGLLFYSQARHKVTFVKSGELIQPQYFDPGWDIDSILKDIGQRTGKDRSALAKEVERLVDQLLKSKVVEDGLR